MDMARSKSLRVGQMCLVSALTLGVCPGVWSVEGGCLMLGVGRVLDGGDWVAGLSGAGGLAIAVGLSVDGMGGGSRAAMGSGRGGGERFRADRGVVPDGADLLVRVCRQNC